MTLASTIDFGPRVGTFSSTSTSTSQGLSYTPSVGPGSVGVGVGGPIGLSLGYFVLGGTTATYNDTFTLQFSILSPQGTNPLMASFMANVTGQVGGGIGAVSIDFLSNTQTFNFNGPDGTGVFTLTLPDKVITNFNTENFLIVQINQLSFTPAPVPEPATLLLAGTGLAGLWGTVRRRRQRSN